MAAQMITTCFSTASGWYCGCLRISVVFSPRVSWSRVALSRSRAELGERRQLAVLRQVEAQLAGHLPHRLDLRGAAHAGDADAGVDRGPLALVEEVGLQVDLPVGDLDHVRRDVGRHVAGLRLDDRQRGQRAAAVLLVQARGALEQAAVQSRRRRPGYASRPGGRRSSSDTWR